MTALAPLAVLALSAGQQAPPAQDFGSHEVVGKTEKTIRMGLSVRAGQGGLIATVRIENRTKEEFGLPPLSRASINFELRDAPDRAHLAKAKPVQIERSGVIYNLKGLERRDLFYLIPGASIEARFRVRTTYRPKTRLWIQADYYWPTILDDKENQTEFEMKSDWVPATKP